MAKLLVICTLLVLNVGMPCMATVYTVGDSAGWDISADLPSWVAGKSFNVGDVLLFQYSSSHTINEVDKHGFDNCNATNGILTSSDGNTSIPLTAPGKKYFMCGAFLHCLGGMKLQVSVNGDNALMGPAGAPESPEAPAYPVNPVAGRGNPFANSSGFSHGVRGSLFVVALSWAVGILNWLVIGEL